MNLAMLQTERMLKDVRSKLDLVGVRVKDAPEIILWVTTNQRTKLIEMGLALNTPPIQP